MWARGEEALIARRQREAKREVKSGALQGAPLRGPPSTLQDRRPRAL